jgi:signal transduction histidine kinase
VPIEGRDGPPHVDPQGPRAEPARGLDDARQLAFALIDARRPLELRDQELFLAGRCLTGDTGLVDHVLESTGFGCTLFAGNRRVATTAVAAGGEGRAYGTTANDDITRQVLRLGQPFRGITRTIGKDWVIAYDPLRVEGRIVGMVAVYRELLSFVGDLREVHSSEAVLLVAPDGRLIDLSAAAVDHAAQGRDELIGRTVEPLLGVDFAQLPRCDLDLELTWSQPDGFSFPVRAMATWLPGRGHLVVCRDYSSEVAARRSLAEANAQLTRAKRVAERADEAKSMFLANVSHELRTPLTAVLGYTELLREEVPEEHDPDLQRVESSARYLLHLIDDLLDLTRAKAGRMEVDAVPLVVGPLLDDVLEVAAPLAARNRNTLSRNGRAAAPVRADPMRVRQVLLNLLTNAAKFTDDGTIEVVVVQQGEHTDISVRDSGVGMDAEQLDELFEAFRQVHRSRRAELGGTGLGLALSRQLARAMGGDLTVCSTKGVGSTFTLRLPTCREY